MNKITVYNNRERFPLNTWCLPYTITMMDTSTISPVIDGKVTKQEIEVERVVWCGNSVSEMNDATARILAGDE